MQCNPSLALVLDMVLLGWGWSKPPSQAKDHRDLDFNYTAEDCCSEAAWTDERLQSIERQGFAINHSRVKIGHGQEEAFIRAKNLLQDWRHFQLGWAFVPRETPIERGQGFNVCSKEGLFWIVNPLRLRYIRDDREQARKNNKIVYAFGSGTLQGHLLAGEERFSVEWNKEDDSICSACSPSSQATR
ncbi:UPF0548 protein At2g17695 isoform X2 [Selaginella moellendorffii]|uniref:UPF0548 protein At2g17695 isoform X2 n=1 Tax=Selaginella moellendorffii TaxID=88036 RepID=UPI000D1C5F33|nr:UPF0548 protein At2g17695 isoform X2 [Selaginella moellendorffii]|eukprot:XP_024540154.1 UPF0548 protein At2g17695 isoform X2 [Selaginella moellendorffii]